MKNILGLLLIFVVAGGFLLFWDSSPEQFLKKPATVSEESPKADSFMRNSLSRTFGQSGAIEYQLVTEETRFFKGSGRYELDQPRLELTRESDETLHLTANRGTIYRTGKRILLKGEVYAWKLADGGRYEVRTPRLTFYPEQKIAEGSRKVRFISPRGYTNAVGFKAYFEEDRFELLASVKSYHAP